MEQNRLFDAIDESKGALISFLRDLVSIPTVVPPGSNYEDAISMMRDKMKDIDFKCTLVDAELKPLKELGMQTNLLHGRRPNLIAVKQWGTGGPNILLNGHIDVVPAGEGWKYPPFSATVRDNLMFGRGTSDMKGSIAAMVFALSALAQLDSEMKGSITLSVTVDEEIGGTTGLLYLVKKGLVKGDCCLVADSSIESIKYAANGCLRFKIITYGKAAHSSRPWMGINAIEKMVKVLSMLMQHTYRLSNVRSRIPVHRSFEIDSLRPTMSIGVINGGLKVNVVPDRCEALVDRRVIPEEKVVNEAKKVLSLIDELKRSDPNLSVTVDYSHFHDSFESDPKSWGVQLLSEAYTETAGVSPFLGGSPGCTDGCYTANAGIPTMLLGAARAKSGGHSRDEFVDLNDVVMFSKIVAKFLNKALTSGR
ncbi:MAG: M20 family metallopeptidase [Promethearchaeati archaeon SRVP18_Atabeyarchaeia-1]